MVSPATTARIVANAIADDEREEHVAAQRLAPAAARSGSGARRLCAIDVRCPTSVAAPKPRNVVMM